jgi:flagellar basal body-associated protein FliL
MANGDRRISVKRLVLFVFFPLVLLIGAAVGVLTSGLLKGSESNEPPPPPKIDLTKLPGGYVDVPDLIINMRGPDGTARLLIMQVTMHLELADSRPLVQAELPKVQSALILYLRKQNPDALYQSSAVEKLRQDMEKLAAEAIKPQKLLQLTIGRMQVR